MAGKEKVIHKGQAYYSVGATARMLSTSSKKVWEMMGTGDLEATQLRVNGWSCHGLVPVSFEQCLQ